MFYFLPLSGSAIKSIWWFSVYFLFFQVFCVRRKMLGVIKPTGSGTFLVRRLYGSNFLNIYKTFHCSISYWLCFGNLYFSRKFKISCYFHLLPKIWLWNYLIHFYCIYSYIHFYFPIIFIYVCLFCLTLPEVLNFNLKNRLLTLSIFYIALKCLQKFPSYLKMHLGWTIWNFKSLITFDLQKWLFLLFNLIFPTNFLGLFFFF